MIECQCTGCLNQNKGSQIIKSLQETKKFCEKQIIKEVLEIWKFNDKTDYSNLEYYRTKLKLINNLFEQVGITNE